MTVQHVPGPQISGIADLILTKEELQTLNQKWELRNSNWLGQCVGPKKYHLTRMDIHGVVIKDVRIVVR
jgi:hypothetical protein